MTAPNTDLADIRQKWLAFCAIHDDLVCGNEPCICPDEDHRPVIAALVGEVETLRAEVARLVSLLQPAEADEDDLMDAVLRQRLRIQDLTAEVARLTAECENDQRHTNQAMDEFARDVLGALDQMATPTAPSADLGGGRDE